MTAQQTQREITKGAARFMAREMFGPEGTAWTDEHRTSNGLVVRLCKVGDFNPGQPRRVRGAGATWEEALKAARESRDAVVGGLTALERFEGEAA